MTRAQGPDDSAIHEATQLLRYAISNLADSSFRGQPFTTPKNNVQREAFDRLTDDHVKRNRYLKDVKFESLVVEATIWDFLIQNLLSTARCVHGHFSHGGSYTAKSSRSVVT